MDEQQKCIWGSRCSQRNLVVELAPTCFQISVCAKIARNKVLQAKMNIVSIHQCYGILPGWQIFIEVGFIEYAVSEAHWEGVE